MFAFLSNVGSSVLSACKAAIGGCLTFIKAAGAFIATAAKATWSTLLGWMGSTTTAVTTAIPVIASEGAIVPTILVGGETLTLVGGEAIAVAGAEAIGLPIVAATAIGLSWWAWALVGLGIAVLTLGVVSLGRVLHGMYLDGIEFKSVWASVKTTVGIPVEVIKDASYLIKTGTMKTWGALTTVGGLGTSSCSWTWDKVCGAGSTVASWFKKANVEQGGVAKDMGMGNDPDINAIDPEVAAELRKGQPMPGMA
jgi:hypothetical protein